jgi:hypothetical protein
MIVVHLYLYGQHKFGHLILIDRSKLKRVYFFNLSVLNLNSLNLILIKLILTVILFEVDRNEFSRERRSGDYVTLFITYLCTTFLASPPQLSLAVSP